MLEVRVKIDGINDLMRNLNKIPKNASRRSLGKAAKAGAEPIERAAKQKAPVDTGRLRDSIYTKFAYQSSRVARVQISTNVKPKGNAKYAYDFFQEFGTSYHPAHPYMRPAADEQENVAVEKVKETMAEAVLQEVKRYGHR